MRLPVALPVADADAWLAAVAACTLSPVELAAWRADRSAARRGLRRRSQWLLGRLAAKDVVRQLVLDRDGRSISRGDVEVITGAFGAPLVVEGGSGRVPTDIRISISHVGRTVVALGCLNPLAHGAGIDIELVERAGAIVRTGLSDAERDELDTVPSGRRAELAVRFWCAKEAVAKALGVGLGELGGPRRVTVTRGDGAGDRLQVRYHVDGTGPRRRLTALASRYADVVVASALDLRHADTRTR